MEKSAKKSPPQSVWQLLSALFSSQARRSIHRNRTGCSMCAAAAFASMALFVRVHCCGVFKFGRTDCNVVGFRKNYTTGLFPAHRPMPPNVWSFIEAVVAAVTKLSCTSERVRKFDLCPTVSLARWDIGTQITKCMPWVPIGRETKDARVPYFSPECFLHLCRHRVRKYLTHFSIV